jgi:hypothetical protein
MGTPLVAHKIDLDHFREFVKVYATNRTIDGKLKIQTSRDCDSTRTVGLWSHGYDFGDLVYIYMTKYGFDAIEVPDQWHRGTITFEYTDCYHYIQKYMPTTSWIRGDFILQPEPVTLTLTFHPCEIYYCSILCRIRKPLYVHPKHTGLLSAIGRHGDVRCFPT